MSWNNSFDILTFGLLLNGIAGSVLFLIWRSLSRLLKDWLDVQAAYRILHVVILFFACPIFGILEAAEARSYIYGNSVLSPMISAYHRLWWGFVAIWAAGTIFLAIRNLMLRQRVYYLVRRGSMSANLDWQQAVGQARISLGLKRKVACREYYGESSPFVVGVLRTTIYVPVGTYTTAQMYVMALHELNHVKSLDLWWKFLSEFVRIIYWPMIPVWYLTKAADDWSEYCCDFLSCQALGNYTEYFDVLTELIFTRMQWFRPAWVSTFCNDKTELAKRVRSLAKQKRLSAFRMRCVLLASVLFCFMGSGTVLAATRSLNMEYRNFYWDELDKEIIELEDCGAPPALEGTYGSLEGLGLDAVSEDEWLDDSDENCSGMTTSGVLFFDLGLEPGQKAMTAPLYDPEMESIHISCSTDELQGSFRMGIVDSNGTCRYLDVTDIADDTNVCKLGRSDYANEFMIDEPDTYQFFIINTGDTYLSVFGMFSLVIG